MLGLPDPWIWGVYVLCVLSAILCVVYGVVTWNHTDDDTEIREEDREWAKHEDEFEEKL